MRLSLKHIPLFALCFAFLVAGCEGPAGPGGPAGEAGEDGQQGIQGPPGSANVTVETISFDAEDLEEQDDGTLMVSQEIGALDSDAVENGAVQAFVEQFEDGSITDTTTDDGDNGDGGEDTTGTAMASVAFSSQGVSDSVTVTVDSVSLSVDGYVAVHDSTLLGADGEPFTEDDQPIPSVIGVSDYLEAGDYTDVEVELFGDVPGTEFEEDSTLFAGEEPADSTLLIAMPHQETNMNEMYNFIETDGAEDGPFVNEEGNAVVALGYARPDTTGEEEDDDGNGDGDTGVFARNAGLSSGFGPEGGAATRVNGNEGSVWAALPYTMYTDDGESSIRYSYDTDGLHVTFASTDGSFDDLEGQISMKVVVIPPSGDGAETDTTDAASSVVPGLNLGDYETFEELTNDHPFILDADQGSVGKED